MRLLLDTCTFLWAVSDETRLSAEARGLIIDGSNEVYLSAISTWEIALKHSRGALELPASPDRYIPEIRKAHAIEPLPLHEEASLWLTRLPALHRDPFDRMLVSQAAVHGLALLTPDPQIRQYPVRTIW